MTSATTAVTDSKAAKTKQDAIDQARTSLRNAIDTAQELLDGSLCKVSGNGHARALIDGNGTDRHGHAKRRRLTRRRIISLRAPANSRNRTRPLTHQKRVLPSRVNKFFHSSV